MDGFPRCRADENFLVEEVSGCAKRLCRFKGATNMIVDDFYRLPSMKMLA